MAANLPKEETYRLLYKFTMPANLASKEIEMVDAALAWLRERLPAAWAIERSRQANVGESSELAGRGTTIALRSPGETFTTFALEARRSLAPRDVDRLLPEVTRVIRELAGNIPILIIAPWLSERTQGLLASRDINFIDLTGNARVALDNPALFVSSTGATRNPKPSPRGQARVRGPKAGRLVRLLADVRPPYGVGELAAASGLTPGYVSRLLDTLDREGVVERSRRERSSQSTFPACCKDGRSPTTSCGRTTRRPSSLRWARDRRSNGLARRR